MPIPQAWLYDLRPIVTTTSSFCRLNHEGLMVEFVAPFDLSNFDRNRTARLWVYRKLLK